MPKADRDPDKWRSRENTWVKHDILFEYLKGFITVLSTLAAPPPRQPAIHRSAWKEYSPNFVLTEF